MIQTTTNDVAGSQADRTYLVTRNSCGEYDVIDQAGKTIVTHESRKCANSAVRFLQVLDWAASLPIPGEEL